MNRVASSLIFASVVLATSQLQAATVKLDAIAYDTRNASDFGPPAVPLVTDGDGNVLNPTVGQAYAILVTLSVSDLGTLPGGTEEKGIASLQFEFDLHGLLENGLHPGWNLEQQNLDLNGSPPGGCCVPLWLDLDSTLNDIALGVDVADFARSEQPPNNPIFDLRRTVGQGQPLILGSIFVDYQAGETRLDVSIDSFEVHDLENVYPGVGLAVGDTLYFVPEPSSMTSLLIGAVVTVVGWLCVRPCWYRPMSRRKQAGVPHHHCGLELCEERRILAILFELAGTQQLSPQPPVNVSTFPGGGGPLLPNDTYQDEMGFTVSPANPLLVAGATHRIVPNPQNPGNPTVSTIDVVTSNDGGKTWNKSPIDDSTELLDDPNAVEVVAVRGDPVLEFDSLGNLYVAYLRALTKDGIAKSDLVIAARPAGGSNFTQFRSVDQVDTGAVGFSVHHQPRLAIGRDASNLTKEALYATYNRYVTSGIAEVRVTGSNDLLIANNHFAFATPVTINDAALSNPPTNLAERFPDIAIGPSGEVHVTWHASGSEVVPPLVEKALALG